MNLKFIPFTIFLTGILSACHASKNYLQYGQNGSRSDCLSDDIKDPIRKNEDGFCECDEGLFRHDSLNRCVSPPNGICTLRSRDGLPITTCTEYAMCWSLEPVDPKVPRQNGICHCEPDAKVDIHTGLCKLKHSSSRCTKLTDCDVMSLVTCRYSNCQCQDNDFQTYNKTAGRCEALVGGSCGISSPPFPAAECHGPNMKCEENKCACDEGYAQTHDKKCAKLTKSTHICQGGGGGYGWGSYSLKAVSREQEKTSSDTDNSEEPESRETASEDISVE